MYLCCNTKSLRFLRYKNQWHSEQVLNNVASTGVKGVIMETELFPERAMYWTRMAREKAAQMGMNLVAIYREADLTHAPKVNETIADLREWVRIAALSNIPYVKIELTGAAPKDYQALKDAWMQVIEYAGKYGTNVILGAERVLTLDELVMLVKQTNFSNCRIAVRETEVVEAIMPWIKEITITKKPPVTDENNFVTIEPVNVSVAVEEIRKVVVSVKEMG